MSGLRALITPSLSKTLLGHANAWTGTNSFIDNNLSIIGSSDATKVLKIEVDGLTTATTRTLTAPDANGTLALLGLAQTWTATQAFAAITATTIIASGAITTGADTVTSGFLNLNGPASAQRALRFRSASVTLWEFGTSGAESGSNAGANLSLDARSDAGAFIDSPISVTRAAGGSLTFSRPITAQSTLAVTGTSTFAGINATSIGATTRGTVQATTGDFNSTLNVTGAITASSTLTGVTAQINGQTSLSAAAVSSWGAPLMMAAGSSIQYGGIAVGANANPCYIYLGKTRAASGTGSTLLTTGDELVELTGVGANGTGFIESCSMKYFCEGTVSSSAMPGRIEFWTTAAGAASTTKRLSIDSAGLATFVNNVSITGTLGVTGTTTCAALNASGAITSTNVATENRFTLNDSGTANLPTAFVLNHTTSGTPANGFGVSMTWRASDSTTASVDMAYVYASWATAAHATRKARLQLDVNDAGGERAGITIDTDGSGAQIALFGAGSYGGGRQVIFFANSASVPSSNPTGGGVLYADAGALKWRGSSGTVTTIAPP